MQTSAISYRVADFLKQYPPFQSMELADLLELAAHGRVKFHEIDEYILWEKTPHGPHVFVIQHGTVSIVQATPKGEQLFDMRGPGDVLGIDRFHGLPANIHSAKSASDVVIYALPADTFAQMLDKYPQAKRYIEAHSSLTAKFTPIDQRKGHYETLLYEALRPTEPTVCAPGNSVRQAARRMLRANSEAIAVVDAQGHIAGVLTANHILQAVADAAFDPTAPAEQLMDSAPAIIPPDSTVSQTVLALGSTGVAAVTHTGARNSPLQGLVTVADLGPAFGDHPSAILLEIPRAANTEVLRRLQQRSRTFALELLTSPASTDWLAEFLYLADNAILKRVTELIPPPAGSFAWCLYGTAGRSESLSPMLQRAAVIIGDGLVKDSFIAWYEKVNAALLECGYVDRKVHFNPAYSCASLSEWKKRFTTWIEDPLNSSLHYARHLFDMRHVLGDVSLAHELESLLKDEARKHTSFVYLLANDCMSSLPPLTFFRDAVIDDAGETSSVFELEKSALRPLVDVGRVFGIAAGHLSGASTQDRFRLARTLLPEHESIFREASEALRAVLYQQARSAIRNHDNGSTLNPAHLSHYDRQLLKTGFRSIHRLLEFTADGAWMETA